MTKNVHIVSYCTKVSIIVEKNALTLHPTHLYILLAINQLSKKRVGF